MAWDLLTLGIAGVSNAALRFAAPFIERCCGVTSSLKPSQSLKPKFAFIQHTCQKHHHSFQHAVV